MIAASSLPFLWSVIAYPIDKGTVFVGPITAYMGMSVGLWLLLSTLGLGTALWTHFRSPAMRRPSWFALSAAECAYILSFGIAGSVISYTLNDFFILDWGVWLLGACAIGLVVSLRQVVPRMEVGPK